MLAVGVPPAFAGRDAVRANDGPASWVRGDHGCGACGHVEYGCLDHGPADHGLRVLMLGNSLTTTHDLPSDLASLLGGEVVVHARGGARLAEHLNPETRNGARTRTALDEGGWDFVVLQETSAGPVTSPDRYADVARRLCKMVRDAGAVPVIYATWAFADDSLRLDRLGMTRAEMAREMGETFARVASENDALLADVGGEFLFRGAGDGGPGGLLGRDGVHPTEEGARVAASVLARTMLAALG